MSDTTTTQDRIASRLKMIEFTIWGVASFTFLFGTGWLAASGGIMPYESAVAMGAIAGLASAIIAILSMPAFQWAVGRIGESIGVWHRPDGGGEA